MLSVDNGINKSESFIKLDAGAINILEDRWLKHISAKSNIINISITRLITIINVLCEDI